MGFHPPLRENEIARRWSREARGTALSIYRRIVGLTPIDQRIAASNWTISVGAEDFSVDMTKTSPEANPRIDARKVAEFETIWIQNNVAYIGPLEYGHSSQARNPDGMVRITIEEFADS